MQVHRPRNIPCVVCGERRMFRYATNMVQHVESGACICSGCRGRDEARKKIHDFVR